MTDTSLLFVFATPISSMTGACGETRQSITIPSRLPLSSPHLPCVFITLCPHHFLSITLNLLAFLPLFLSPFIPHVDSHCLLIRYPLLSHCSKPTVGLTERKKEGACHSGCDSSSCFPLRHTLQKSLPDTRQVAVNQNKVTINATQSSVGFS